MKKIFSTVFAFALASMLHAQSTNYAISNSDGTGKISAFTITELNNCNAATFQMWIKPTELSAAKLIKQDNFSIELDGTGKILIKNGSTTAEASLNDILNKWSQLTIVIDNGNVKLYLNNNEVAVTGTVDTTIKATTLAREDKGCIIAEGLKGYMDEIRVWDIALEQDDFFWRNTLNKFNNNYNNLIAYWKCDQNQCANFVDYKFAHHGEFDKITRAEVTDNSQFKYRIVTGYTNLMRFIDRPNINREMFLMTNDLILLSAKVQQDGSLFPEYPDNSFNSNNAEYLETFEGRTGVISLNGNAEGVTSIDNRVFSSPTDKFGFGMTQKATFQTWMYIDEWKEGAEIFSNKKDDENYITIKLGKEGDKELIVDFCGTIGSITNKLETQKWQYLGVYFTPDQKPITDLFSNPLSIGFGSIENGEVVANVYNKLSKDFPVVLSGKDVTTSYIPLFSEGTMTIGKNFKGKFDEMQVWGSSRSGAIKSDASSPYKLNIGNWDNIFLNAYWKFDEKDNIGKDSQSYLGMIDFIKNYYKNHTGYKIRIGIIYPDGEKWKLGVLNKEENLDRLIRDAKELIKHCDGLDVDLEWMYSPSDWQTYNNIIKRLINEVMANEEDKVFTCSLHSVSHNGFDQNLTKDVDYFTFQMYGPQIQTYQWDYYPNSYSWFKNAGFPNDKILLSYGILLVGNGEEGYKDLFEKYGMNDDNYDPDLNTWMCGGTEKYFNGVNQTKRKQEYIIDNDCRGTMYFDMGNDQPVQDYKSLIRAQNEVIASNVDTLITEVIMAPSAVNTPEANGETENIFYVNSSSDNLEIVLIEDNEPAYMEMFSIDGKIVAKKELVQKRSTINRQALEQGIYIFKVKQGNKINTVKVGLN